MTPRQLNGWVQLGYRRRLGWNAELLTLMRASQADNKGYNKFMKRLREDSQ